jgi:PIN like domain
LKNRFSEFYKLDEAVLKQHWQEDIFSFDANVLLNLYRYTPKTRDAFFNVLEKLKDRVWISYQAAFEYQRNRLKVIHSQKEAYDEIRKLLEKKKSEIENKLNEFKRHPYLKTEELKIRINSAFDSISKDVYRLEKDHPNYLDNDPIWDRLTKLLSDKVGDDFTSDELEKLFREGKRRYDDEIPPGYMDQSSKKNSGNRSLYGDLIVWKQTIKQAKDKTSSVIFITDDRKEDWWYKFQGKTIGPQPDLIKEFKDETGKQINIYQADNFLELASKNLNEKLNQEAVDEIREIRFADELEVNLLASTIVSAISEVMDNDGSIKKGKISAFESSIKAALEDQNNRENLTENG